MNHRLTISIAALVAMAFTATNVHADSHQEIYSVGTAGRLHESGGVFLPVFDNDGSRTDETVFLLQGGYPSELDAEPVSDTWVLAEDYWQNITSSAPAMANHSLVAAGGRAYALGGIGEDDWLRPLSRIVVFEIRRIDGRIEVVVDEIRVQGSAPDTSFGASAVAVNGGRSLLYVGGTYLGNPLDPEPSQLWEFRIADDRWHRLADLPADLSNHTAIAARDSVWVFGGDGSEGLSNEVYRYDLASDSWSRIEPVGVRPDPRQDHGAVVAGNTMLIFGGIEEPFFPETMDDVWQFNLDTLVWTEKTPMATGLSAMAVAVVPRSMASSRMVDVLIYGGVVDAWSFPLDLSDSTCIYTSDVFGLQIAHPDPREISWEQ